MRLGGQWPSLPRYASLPALRQVFRGTLIEPLAATPHSPWRDPEWRGVEQHCCHSTAVKTAVRLSRPPTARTVCASRAWAQVQVRQDSGKECFCIFGWRAARRMDALLALKEATKLAYDNWRIWDNLLQVSVVAGQTDEAVLAFSRILDLHPESADPMVRACWAKRPWRAGVFQRAHTHTHTLTPATATRPCGRRRSSCNGWSRTM